MKEYPQNGSTPKATIVTATKAMIDELRSQNVHNRTIKAAHVEYLRKEIIADRFMLTNQGIAISRNGMVLDGGHRLEAIAKAGYPPVQLLIVEGLDPAVQLCVDTHAKRTMADTLALALNQKLSARLVAALTTYWRANYIRWGSTRPSPYDLKELIAFLGDQIRWASAIDGMFKLAAPVVAAGLAAWPNQSIDGIGTFFVQVINGEEICRGDASYALREYLSKSAKLGGGLRAQRERYERTLFAISAHLADNKVDRLLRMEKWDEDALEHSSKPKNELISELVSA